MDVDMADTLSRGCIHIHSDIVAIGTELVVNYLALGRHQLHTSSHLFRGELEEAGTVPERHDQGMTRADGVAVARAVRQRVTPRHPAWCAEKARIVRITHP